MGLLATRASAARRRCTATTRRWPGAMNDEAGGKEKGMALTVIPGRRRQGNMLVPVVRRVDYKAVA